MAEPRLHIFGIRHHGPGSARSLCRALESLRPDCILLEGPPDAQEILALATHREMKPPVALLIYDPEHPRQAAYYPFAEFSPEWQAIQFGLGGNIPVRFIDLPQGVHLALAAEEAAKAAALIAELPPDSPVTEGEVPSGISPEEAPAQPSEVQINLDPLSHLARAAGYSDSERWWEHLVEHRRDSSDVFAAVLEAMTALRDAAVESALQSLEPQREARREAYMRQSIRAAQKEGFAHIAVVCGAWHAPALATMPPARDDVALLKSLPKRKVAATWVPWTYRRLASRSGYGAGVSSPGWYDFLWKQSGRRQGNLAIHWLAKVARLLRAEDLDASSASLIEAVRLADSLAALRGRPLPGLPELNEATQTVFCFGDPLPLQLISEKLVVSERLGGVPEETPSVPLAQDLAREQKRLRFPPEALPKQFDFDLRKPNDLDRSRLLHRLNLIGVSWGERQRHRGAQKGTFHELWLVQWEPEFAVQLIEAGVWGNSISAAASAKVCHHANTATELPALTGLLDTTLLADLPDAAEHLMTRVQAVAALASDVNHLMGALPSLASIQRYGNVRKTDAEMVAAVVNGLVARICIGLPGACGSLNDEAAEEMFKRILETHTALGLLQNSEHTASWNAVLRCLVDLPHLHGLIAGRACRLLRDAQQIEVGDGARRLSLALSTANAPAHAAAWVDGFLRDSGLLLIHDTELWRVMDEWITHLSTEHFISVLPLLRRTFTTFQPAERRQMGHVVASGTKRSGVVPAENDRGDVERADRALPLLAKLLGLKMEAGQ